MPIPWGMKRKCKSGGVMAWAQCEYILPIFPLNFHRERDFHANEIFSQKIRKVALKMAGHRDKKNCDRWKKGGRRPEMPWQIIGTEQAHCRGTGEGGTWSAVHRGHGGQRP